MKKLILALSLLFAPSLFAETTQTAVTGTITDPNLVPYYPATVQACLTPVTTDPVVNGVHVNTNPGANYCGPLVNTSIAGSFSMNLWPNAGITPGGTQWNFTVAAIGSAPPAGKGPQNFQVAITVSGSSQSVSATLTAAAPVLLNSSGGSNGGLTNLAPAGMINPAAPPYNAKFDAGAQNTCTTTNASNIVTCPNAKFQTGTIISGNPPAVVGQIFFANDATAGGGGVDTCLDNPDITFGGARQTTISSVDSDTQVHVVGNSNTTSTAHACVAWGDDDTTAINAAWAAGGCTSTAALPNAKALVSAPFWQGIAGCPNVSASGTGYQGQRVIGSSVVGTYIIPTPLFNFSSIAGSGSPTCNNSTCKAAVGNPNIADYESFNVWGLGERCSANQANTTLWLVGLATRAVNTNAIGWCGRGGGATLSGYSIIGPTDIYTWGGSNFFGSIGMNFVSVLIYFGNSFISCNASSVNGTSGIVLQAGTSVNSQSNGLSCPVQVGVASGAGAVFNDTNSSINGNDSGNFCLYVGQNSVVNFANNNLICAAPAVNEGAISFFSTSGTGGIVNATNSSLFANGTANTINFGTSNGIFRNNTGNVFSGGSGTFTGTGSLVQGSMSPSSFASMGTPANGSFLYCTDCTIANPCASGGSGALAKRLNNIWVCN